MLPAIKIENLTKFYKKFKALDGVSLEVRAGEFFGFLGPNGAGKTTTISVLTGLANHNSGSVRVFGHDVVAEYRKTRSLIGLAPQEFNFDPYLSVEQILEFEGGYFGMSRSEVKKRAAELLEVFDLVNKRRDGYKKLSGGMKRRLLIARALVHKPRILILDEPTAGVDVELRHHLWSILRRLNREGTTIFLTTHYIEEAEKLCSHIGVIHQGGMVACDVTGELIRKMSGDQVELFLRETLFELPEALRGMPLILEEEGRKLRFEERGELVPRVLKALHDQQAIVEKIDVRRPTLEDVFLKLTAGRQKTVSS